MVSCIEDLSCQGSVIGSLGQYTVASLAFFRVAAPQQKGVRFLDRKPFMCFFPRSKRLCISK